VTLGRPTVDVVVFARRNLTQMFDLAPHDLDRDSFTDLQNLISSSFTATVSSTDVW